MAVRTISAGLLLSVTLAIFNVSAQAAPSRQCSPQQKWICDAASGCQAAEAGYQSAERYIVNEAAHTLTACLWSQCFSGGKPRLQPSRHAFRYSGRLRGEGPARKEHLTLDFLLAPDGRFTATTWTGPQSMSISFGVCGTL